jgi:hypothetical protein
MEHPNSLLARAAGPGTCHETFKSFLKINSQLIVFNGSECSKGREIALDYQYNAQLNSKMCTGKFDWVRKLFNLSLNLHRGTVDSSTILQRPTKSARDLDDSWCFQAWDRPKDNLEVIQIDVLSVGWIEVWADVVGEDLVDSMPSLVDNYWILGPYQPVIGLIIFIKTLYLVQDMISLETVLVRPRYS